MPVVLDNAGVKWCATPCSGNLLLGQEWSVGFGFCEDNSLVRLPQINGKLTSVNEHLTFKDMNESGHPHGLLLDSSTPSRLFPLTLPSNVFVPLFSVRFDESAQKLLSVIQVDVDDLDAVPHQRPKSIRFLKITGLPGDYSGYAELPRSLLRTYDRASALEYIVIPRKLCTPSRLAL